MTQQKKNEATLESTARSYEPLTPEEFELLVAEAQERGESTKLLIKRMVLTTIDEVIANLKAKSDSDS